MIATMREASGSTFAAALPFAIGSLATGGAGAYMALNAFSTVGAISGVALALIGVYAFMGTVACGVAYSGNPAAFRKNIGKFMITAAGQALASMIEQVARSVLQALIDAVINRNRR